MAEVPTGSTWVLPVVICVGSSCYVRGSERVAATFDRLIRERGLAVQIQVTGAFCMEKCSMGVSVRLGDGEPQDVTPEQAEAFFMCEIEPLVRGHGAASVGGTDSG